MEGNYNKHLYNVDFLRFVFALFIVYYHITPIMSKFFGKVLWLDYLSTRNSNVGQVIVISFFVISGFLFFLTEEYRRFSLSTYIKRKVIRIWPVLAFSLIVNFHSTADILNLFFISSGTGLISVGSSNPASWFVCVLFWLELLMFDFLARSNFNSKYNIADSLITDYKVSGEIWGMLVTLTGFILLGQRTGSTLYSAKAFEQLPFLTNGVLMGITGFVYGGLIARFWIRGYSIRKTINKRNKILITILEIVILSYFVNILINCTQKYEKIYYILIFSIIIMDFIYQWGYIAQLLNHKIFGHLGKWSYSIYMMQFPCFAYLKKVCG
ncbi:acyltransferase family protein [Enterocloster citroniae]|uniref:Peptidoglycan/LPS O-acetylase OafA/YrhL n=2 Tax=Enterocloster citroniae TaxID=358743 RepID=A0ABV2FXE9_9FIRM|nr:acyltransferase family protein [Enterocloster citroniae]KMW24250.1 hypothetical protein HMPREF9470_00112 [[Clostridium] citroniae WAL-19142]